MSYQLNKKTGKYDVTAYVAININNELNTGGRLDKLNPGLAGEVEDHEKGHGQQLSEAIKSTLSVKSMFQSTDAKGNVTESKFSGTIDKVLDQASAMYDKIKKESPDAVKGVSKKMYLDNVFKSAQVEIFKAMSNNKDPEGDANKRANNSRNGNMPYTNGQKPIIL